MSIYDFTVVDEDGQSYALAKYKNQPMIIVNTATKCGFAPQFEQLEELYQVYKDRGLIVLGFPSDQFKQEVASAKEAAESCRFSYGVTFPMHELVYVNGKQGDPLFKFLEEQAPGAFGKAIKWNFTKFFIDKNGQVIARFAPKTSPLDMKETIEKYI